MRKESEKYLPVCSPVLLNERSHALDKLRDEHWRRNPAKPVPLHVANFRFDDMTTRMRLNPPDEMGGNRFKFRYRRILRWIKRHPEKARYHFLQNLCSWISRNGASVEGWAGAGEA
jgi:hypothetical protein